METPNIRTKVYLILNVDDSKTDAILIERTNESFILKGIGEAETTVEPPHLDVTIGIKEAIRNLEKSSGKNLENQKRIVDFEFETKLEDNMFLCSSSSGGGLLMIVAGLIGMMTAESAQRAALGAGASIMDRFSIDDGRLRYQRIERMRRLRPDIFLLAGGTDGGAVEQVIDMARLIKSADLKPRFGEDFKLPLIYAGNIQIRKEVSEIFNEANFALKFVENVRPILEIENLGPTKEGIYDSFMQHVIVHSPGYDKLIKIVNEPIIPTQAAIGEILYAYSQENNVNLLGVDLGSTTTDVYSVFNGIFNRSLNANLGLKYSISNIMKTTGITNILRWLPSDITERELRNTIGNMMIHMSKPGSIKEQLIQQALAREAIRLGLEHHKTIATRLKGIPIRRMISDIFDQQLDETHLKDMMNINVIIGKGEALTSAPKNEQSLQILVDAFQPEGVTEVFQDKFGITPHLGMFLKVNYKAATQILTRECLSKLGTCIAPKGLTKDGEDAMKIIVKKTDHSVIEDDVKFGELKIIPLKIGEEAEIEMIPTRKFDIGKGRGKTLKKRVKGSMVGLIIDTRGRPLTKFRNNERFEELAYSTNSSQNMPYTKTT